MQITLEIYWAISRHFHFDYSLHKSKRQVLQERLIYKVNNLVQLLIFTFYLKHRGITNNLHLQLLSNKTNITVFESYQLNVPMCSWPWLFLLSSDPTKIVGPPQDAQVISGTTAQLKCQTEYDESLQGSFEVVWRRDGEELPLSFEENSR